MTWTAQELVNELRHLDPDCEVLILAGPTPQPERPRGAWFWRQPRIAQHVDRVRVMRVDGRRIAFIEGTAT